jgi:1-acyl-sn-glycerol-3-phosphate acyltransferase
MTTAPRRGLLPLLTCQLSAALNDQLFKSALMTWITARQATLAGVDPASMLGLVSAAFIAPFFLFSASAGQLADRFDKTRIVRWAKLAELVIMTVAAVAFARESLPMMLAALFALGVHSSVLGPVKYGILPQLVGPGELVRANAWMEMGTFLAILLGTVLGALLVLMPSGHLWLGASTLTLAGLGLSASFALPRLLPAQPDLRIHLNPVTPMREVLRITRKTHSVYLAVLGISWFWLLGVTLLSFLPSYVHDTLRAEPQLVTVLLALFCVGTAVGSVLAERISGKQLELGLVPVGAVGMTLCLLDLAFVHVQPGQGELLLTTSEWLARAGALRLCTDFALLALFGGLFTVPLYTLIQQRAEPGERARVIAGNNVLNSLFMVVGSLLLALSTRAHVPPTGIFLGLALLSLASSVFVYRLLPEFLLRFCASLLGRTMYRLRVRGAENIPDEGAMVLVCNHVAFNDWLVLAGSVRRPIRFVMDHRMAALPGLASLLRQGKIIPIAPEHEDKAVMEQAFERIRAELHAGEIVCIYPEGKITKTGELNTFKTGVERILKETRVRVVPMAIHGLWGSVFSRKNGPAMAKLPRRFRARLTLQIGTPVSPEEASAKRLEGEVRKLLQAAQD